MKAQIIEETFRVFKTFKSSIPKNNNGSGVIICSADRFPDGKLLNDIFCKMIPPKQEADFGALKQQVKK